MHSNTFLRLVQTEAGLNTPEEARTATKVVFELLHHRITPNEADDLEAQLPRELAAIWEGGQFWTQRLLSRLSPQNRFDRVAFVNEVTRKTPDLPVSGEKLTKAVFYALQSQISEGEAKNVAQQLPQNLRELWQASRPQKAYVGGGGGEIEYTGEEISGEFSKGGFSDTLKP